MSFFPVHMRVCTCCGFDVARVEPVPIGFRVICDPARGGCGAFSAAGWSEAAAIDKWNGEPSPGAVALVAAAARRRQMEGAQHG